MGSNYLTQLANWCRSEGFVVNEVDGWQHRARSSGGYENGRPWCVMWHHTASSTSPQNDINYMCYGSPDAPLANILVARDGVVHVMAGGCTNTNGKGKSIAFSKGTVPADSMNTYAVGVEIANNGVGEQYPQAQIDAMFRLNNMLAARLGLQPNDCCTHNFYAPDRKIDPATAAAVQGPWRPDSVTSSGTWSLPDIEAECLRRVGAEPPPPEDDNMQLVELSINEADARFLAYKIVQNGIDLILWCEWVNGDDPSQLARLMAYRELNAPVFRMALENLSGVGLIGPLPTGDTRHNWQRSDFGNVMT